MLDHVFLPVSNVPRSVLFYGKALAPLGLTLRIDYDGKNGPPGHPDLKGFGKDGRLVFWLREGRVEGDRTHVGFVASSRGQVEAAYQAAIEAGAKDNGAPDIREYYDPRYYAANVFDPDGHSLEFVYKSWQHPGG
jgi:catechol 2,3-dioxygenase-like lactoylglutathione lyase family enzyme